MKYATALRDADSEHAVQLLLNIYVRHLHDDPDVPARLTTPPLQGLPDIWRRFDLLVIEWEQAIRVSNTSAARVIGEAVAVFDTALNRLSQLFEPACGSAGGELDLRPAIAAAVTRAA